MKNIVLIGFMGSGKTSLGKYMSGQNFNFIDTDEYIEKKENRRISEIFDSEGEEYFRDAETSVLNELIAKNIHNTVISVGGGLPVREINRKLLKELGMTVYLRTTIDSLEKRLSNDRTRPLLKNGNIRDKITELMNAREDIYLETAEYIVDTDDKTLPEIYSLIKEALI